MALYLSALLPALAAAQLTSPASIPSQATDLQLQEINAAYDANGLAGTDKGTAFGVELHAQAVMSVVYGNQLVQAQGQAMQKDAVSQQPTILITPTTATASNFSTTSTFTLTLSDASALGHADPQGNFRHFLANGLTPGQPLTQGNATVQLGMGNTVTNYAGPAPNPGEGPHRYAWLLFQQPADFAAPEDLSQSGVGPDHWSVSDYVAAAKLGDLVAAAFFTVENGQAGYSVAPTSSVNPSTLPAASASNSGSGAAPSGSSGGSGGGDSGSGAGQLVMGTAGTMVMGMAAVVALAM